MKFEKKIKKKNQTIEKKKKLKQGRHASLGSLAPTGL
jgi:hypothetical protein